MDELIGEYGGAIVMIVLGTGVLSSLIAIYSNILAVL